MTVVSCPNCGTQATGGEACPLCGTPTPAPAAAIPRYANQWEAILAKLRLVAAPRYRVQRVLGYGGMAGVYLADEPRLGRQVAIKVMSPGLMVDPKLIERFVQEARTIAQLAHPNIVTIYEVDEREDLHYFTMTYVEGRTLGQVMADATGTLPLDVVRAWIYQIGDALGYAHHKGVVHRDVKPGNVLLDLRGNALVTDFGIAKVADVEAGLTRTGMLVGTPAYMSPEQCSSGKVTGASDQYALGAVAYQMLTGQPPFSGPTLSVLQSHVSEEPPPIRALRPDCPDDLLAAVQRMLEKRPEDRWPTMSSAVAAAGASPPGLDGPVRSMLEQLAAQAAAVHVSPWFDVLREGSRESLGVTVVDGSGRTLAGRQVEWSSEDALIAGVTSDGALLALCPGTTRIRATCGSAVTALPVTVDADPIREMTVEPGQASVPTGGRLALEAVVHDWDGRRLDERAVLWSSSDSNIASVDLDGVVEGRAIGVAVVTASTGGRSAAASISVTAEVVSGQARAGPEATLGATPKPARRGAAGAPVPSAATTPIDAAPAPAARAAARLAGAPGDAPVRSRRGLVVVAAAVVLVTGALVLARPWASGGPAAEPESALPAPTAAEPTGPPAAPPATGVLEIAGQLPAGAVILATGADGRPREVTDRTVELEPGGWVLELQAAGYEPDRQTVQVVAGQAVSWTPVLRERAAPPAAGPTNGTVLVAASLPAGASVTARSADGRIRPVAGRSAELAAGSWVFELTAPGYETDRQTVRVRAGETVRWTPTLRSVAAPPPTPTTGVVQVAGTLPAGATLTARGADGRTRPIEGRSVELPAGTWALEFSAPGHAQDQQTVQVRAGDTARWTPVVRATPAPPPDAGDPRADQAAVEAAVREFVAAFGRRDATVLPLFPQSVREGWRVAFENRDQITNFGANVSQLQAPRLSGDEGTVTFTMRVTFRSQNRNVSQDVSYVGTVQRASSGWRLTGLRQD